MQLIQTGLSWVDNLACAQDGRKLIVAGAARTAKDPWAIIVRVFDLPNPDKLNDPWLTFPTNTVVAIDPQGYRIAAAPPMAEVFVFERAEPLNSVGRPMHDWLQVQCMASSSGGAVLAAAGCRDRRPSLERSYEIVLWDIGVDSSITQQQHLISGLPEELAISPDGRYLAMVDSENSFSKLYDLSSGSTSFFDDAYPARLRFSPTSRLLATGGVSIIVFDIATERRMAEFRGQDEDVPSLAFSPDERILAVARTDGPVEFWDVESGQLVYSYDWNIGRLGAIAFAPDGLTCAVAGDQGRIVIWDI